MKLIKKKLVHIITESVLEEQIIEELQSIGMAGYTLEQVKGEGKKGIRRSEWEQSRNIQLIAAMDEELAMKCITHLQDNYSKSYALYIFLTDVEVLEN